MKFTWDHAEIGDFIFTTVMNHYGKWVLWIQVTAPSERAGEGMECSVEKFNKMMNEFWSKEF